LLGVWLGRKFGKFVLVLACWFVVGDTASKFFGIVIGGGGGLNVVHANGYCIFGMRLEAQVLGKIASKERFKTAVDPSACIL